MRDDLLEKNDVPANVERLSHLIIHLKEQEKSYLRFLQKMLVSKTHCVFMLVLLCVMFFKHTLITLLLCWGHHV